MTVSVNPLAFVLFFLLGRESREGEGRKERGRGGRGERERSCEASPPCPAAVCSALKASGDSER